MAHRSNATRDEQYTEVVPALAAPMQLPEHIGRYRIEKTLGKGGFSLVFLARDEQLDRLVAVKVPHPHLVSCPEDAEAYLTEARTVANLDHPNIVPVHDVGSTAECLCYVVSKYIEGTNLARRLEQQCLGYKEAVEIVATVAEALHYAHKQGLVHRDVKPANILIGDDGMAYVVDFGLALREENIGTGPNNAGTPAYMSPEQARGEGHRVDGRSDIFSLGVVLYELLVGKRPFRGKSRDELFERVTSYEPRPLRQYDDQIPTELERICQKALSKRAGDRYSTGIDFAEDLRHLLAIQSTTKESTSETSQGPAVAVSTTSTPDTDSAGAGIDSSSAVGSGSSSDSQPISIVPKGLRSFDAHDADFFLELLPGPRDRSGIPNSIRFWKSRIEEFDPDDTFTVGLIYGPSGCGKSSLVKAGLLPRLSEDVIPIYIEATLEDTEVLMLQALRSRCPALDHNLSLKDTMAALRRGQGVAAGMKVLIVIDQFEQWLHAQKETENGELVQALRQCDGRRVHGIVMVRDDFWMAVTLFFRDLEIKLLEAHNLAAVDLFPERHAQKVLAAYGRAFGTLPADSSTTTKGQKEFLKQAVADLAEDSKVICVRLALFAEMMKNKTWTPAALKAVGGTKGVGFTFLEETFNSSSASPEHRYHQRTARAVLKALLPESGTAIKGQMKSYDELLEASGYARRPKEFDDLIRILDLEIRLITPTDPEGADDDNESVSHIESGQKYYQLTHDYLVPSLRDWLTRKQRETRRGRAELRLAERSALWNAKPENRHLPSLWEWVNIRTLTDKKKWTEPQRKIVTQATRVHGNRAALVAIMIVILSFAAVRLNNVAKEREASRLVDALSNADTSRVSLMINELEGYRRWTDGMLARIFEETEDDSAKLHAGLALLSKGGSTLDYVQKELLSVTSVQFPFVRDILEAHKEELVEPYWKIASDAQQDASTRFQAACALATYDADHENWQDDEFAQFLATHLVNVRPSELAPWRNALRPVQEHLSVPLAMLYRDKSESEQVRSFATDTMADYLSENGDRLFDLLVDAEESQFGVIFDKLKSHRERAVQLAKAKIAESCAEEASEEDKETLAIRQANAATMLVKLDAAAKVWPLLMYKPGDLRVRSYIIHRFSLLGVNPQTLLDRYDQETNKTIQRALLLCLDEFEETRFPVNMRTRWIARLLNDYRSASDAGLHAAAQWLLKNKWGQAEQLAVIDEELQQNEDQLQSQKDDDRQWYINTQGQTFVILKADTFRMGSPNSYDEILHTRRIDRRFAISSTEVTVRQFQLFKSKPDKNLGNYSKTDDSPQLIVTWYAAADYCNWLSEMEGIPENQWCYLPSSDGRYAEGMKPAPDYLKRIGYRLPSEAEWEFACRAGTTTARFYGESVAPLALYAWYKQNAQERSWPVASLKPNDFGFFDMLGNAQEWCHARYQTPYGSLDDVIPDLEDTAVVRDVDARVLRGGSFTTGARHVRSAYRNNIPPHHPFTNFGFRVARTLPP